MGRNYISIIKCWNKALRNVSSDMVSKIYNTTIIKNKWLCWNNVILANSDIESIFQDNAKLDEI